MDWKASSFSGKISHDDHQRLRKIYKAVKQSIPETQEAASTESSEEELLAQRNYLKDALQRVFSSSSKGENEPDKFILQPYEGKITGKREIERMLYVEKVVKEALEKSGQ